MTSEHIFLATANGHVARATCEAGGMWSVGRSALDYDVTCLAADPNAPGVIYAGTRDGVIRSDDTGVSWRRAGMAGHIVKAVAVSPHDSAVIYAGTKPALLFRSDDGGVSWRELDGFRRIPNRWWWFSPAEPPEWRAYVMAIAISPRDPDLILAGIEFGAVVRSEDGGQTWSRHRRGALRDCHSLKFHLTKGDWVYEAGGGGAAVSRDGGRTFRKAKQGMTKSYGIVCGVDPEKPEIWYVCVARGPGKAFGRKAAAFLYRSAGGAGWQPIGWQPHPLPVAPTALEMVPGRPGELYAGLMNGEVWHTADYGASWRQMPFNLGGVWFSLLILAEEA